MTNPFTRFLRSLRDRPPTLDTFIRHWDTVEEVVIESHRQGAATPAQQAAYAAARTWLLTHYAPTWAPRLAPHWPATLEGGAPTPSDPIPRILATRHAADFANNWPALQALAAARESVNRYVMDAADSG